MQTFTIKWIIDIEADTAEQAAFEAWDILKDPSPDNLATILDVYDCNGVKLFDMGELDNDNT